MSRMGRPISFDPKSVAAKTESQAMEYWGLEATRLIKRGMQARNWGYQELAEALKTQGVKRSAAVINRRINRGNFPAGFLLACLNVLEKAPSNAAGVKPEDVAAEAPKRPPKQPATLRGDKA
jgi:hypothetical protein